jgi:Transglycosylase
VGTPRTFLEESRGDGARRDGGPVRDRRRATPPGADPYREDPYRDDPYRDDPYGDDGYATYIPGVDDPHEAETLIPGSNGTSWASGDTRVYPDDGYEFPEPPHPWDRRMREHGGDGYPDVGAGRQRARRWPRLLRRTIVTAGCLVLVAAIGFGLLLVLTPSVSDAKQRVARLTASEHTPQLSGPLPARVVSALVATEDSRFYGHDGVDPIGAVRGTFGPIVGDGDQGGATLDQQLAKMLYTGGHRTFADRIEQIGLALKIDDKYSKSDILRMYLDSAYFGHGFYGITAASRGYFNREPTSLTWGQASMLAGLVQAPSLYDPIDHPAAGRARQRHVLDRLVATGRMTRAGANAVAAEPLGLTS